METQQLMLDTMQCIIQAFEKGNVKKLIYGISKEYDSKGTELLLLIFDYAMENGIVLTHNDCRAMFLSWGRYVLFVQFLHKHITVVQSSHSKISPNRHVDFSQFYIDYYYGDPLDPIANRPKEIDERFAGIL